MNIRTNEQRTYLKQQTALATPNMQTKTPNEEQTETPTETIQIDELWSVIRGVLVIWAIGVWLLLIMMPGVQLISDAGSAMLHLPHIFIGLGLIGAIFASYDLRSDGHMLWFLAVLLMIAGWM